MPLIGKAQWSARESLMNTGRLGVKKIWQELKVNN